MTRSERHILSHLTAHPRGRLYDFHAVALGISLNEIRYMTLCRLLKRTLGGPKVGIYWTATKRGLRLFTGNTE